MRAGRRASVIASVVAILAVAAGDACAHSASDAYLTLTTVAGGAKVHAQWDIALRDLDFVLRIDDDGDGKITWREFQARRSMIERYAYGRLVFDSGGKACSIEPGRVQIAEHADGAYAALFFDVSCRPGSTRISLDYRLFFAVDPSHRAIVVWRRDADVATAVLSPQVPRIGIGGSAR